MSFKNILAIVLIAGSLAGCVSHEETSVTPAATTAVPVTTVHTTPAVVTY